MTPDETKAKRLELAILLCEIHPNLYEKATATAPIFDNEKEENDGTTLMLLMRLEPSIKQILDYYQKRRRENDKKRNTG